MINTCEFSMHFVVKAQLKISAKINPCSYTAIQYCYFVPADFIMKFKVQLFCNKAPASLHFLKCVYNNSFI